MMSSEAQLAETPTPAPAPTWWGGSVLALVIVLAVLGAAIAIFLSSRETNAELRQALAEKLAESAGAQKAAATLAEQTQKDLRDSQSRISLLEAKLADFQGQRVALEEMYRELARAPDDWLLAEVEQTLNIASRELTLAGNVRGALIALQTADQRLSRADKLQVVQLRRAITQDMERLKALPQVDVQGMSLKLDNLMTLTSTLPLSIPDTLGVPEKSKAKAVSESSATGRVAADFWRDMQDLVRIRRLDNNDAALLTPQQSYFLRENLKLRLLSARTALIARDDVNFKEDLRLARDMLVKYFDIKAKVNANAIAQLKQFADGPVSITTPDITVSLGAIRAARVARERVSR